MGQHEIEIAVAVRGLVEYGSGAWPSVFVVEKTIRKRFYEQAVLEDYSLSEIARDAGISRQGVHDMIRRCNKSLEDYEAKLHLVEKFMSVKKKVHEIDLLLENYEEQDEKELIKKVKKLSGEIIEEL